MILEKQTIRKAIEINASTEKVWEVLIADSYNRIWFAEFSEGTFAETDWQVGSKAVFTDHSNTGIIGKIMVNEPRQALVVEYTGIVKDGTEDYESEGAQSVIGSYESYFLTDKNGSTHLAIEADMGPKYFDMMSNAWQRALEKIKELAES